MVKRICYAMILVGIGIFLHNAKASQHVVDGQTEVTQKFEWGEVRTNLDTDISTADVSPEFKSKVDSIQARIDAKRKH